MRARPMPRRCRRAGPTPMREAMRKTSRTARKRHTESIADTLDLEPDGSLLDFADDVEAIFGIRFARDPSIVYRTVGDVYHAVIAIRGNPESRVGSCGSLLAFNRI